MIEFENLSIPDRIQALWAQREIMQPTMNAQRRDWFEGVKVLLTERDLPKSITHPPEPAKVVGLWNDKRWRVPQHDANWLRV